MKFSVYQVSRKGGRTINEDRLGYSYTRDAVLLVLADGMGGHPEGEQAADIAVRHFSEAFMAAARPALADPQSFLVQTLNRANQAIVDYAVQRQMDDNPRTTLVAAVIQHGRLHAIHCGDSRLYRVRRGRVLERTRDHSYSEQAGRIKPPSEQVNRSVLFTCLGSPVQPIYDLAAPMPLHEGDRLLLCSDGLWSMIDDGDIGQRLSEGALDRVVPDLADLAVTRGGRHGDNVTCLALEWASPDEFEPTHVISTDEVGEDGFSSTFQPPPDIDELVRDLDDEAIDRTIAEINEAIRRTARRSGP